MANSEWWQRGPIDGIPAVLQPIAHILLQVRESVGEIVEPLTEQEWNARPAGVASAAYHRSHRSPLHLRPRRRAIDRTTRDDSVGRSNTSHSGRRARSARPIRTS